MIQAMKGNITRRFFKKPGILHIQNFEENIQLSIKKEFSDLI